MTLRLAARILAALIPHTLRCPYRPCTFRTHYGPKYDAHIRTCHIGGL